MKKLMVIVLLLGPQAALAAQVCETVGPNKAYVKVEASVQARIAEFANKKVVATQADALLSKLITAKSPVLIQWMKKRDLDSKSEDEIAREWREYYAKNFVLGKYPGTDGNLDSHVEQLVDGILKDFVEKAFKDRMEALFQRAKKAALATVDSMGISSKTEIKKRIEAVRLYWPRDLKTARNNAMPLDIIDWGIAYDPGANEINMGLRALAYPTDETYLGVFAHELGHSFDSCRWGAFFPGEWPFKKIGECLRRSESVGAKKRDDTSLETFIKAGKIPSDAASGLRQNPTCNRIIYPPPGIQADQLPEAFADWFSAEVLAQIPNLDVTKIRQDLCVSKQLVDGSSYPTNEARLNRIYFAHSKFKIKSGAQENSSAVYCPLQ